MTERQEPVPADNTTRPVDKKQEVVFYEGSPLLRGELAKVFGWGTVALVLIGLAVVALVVGFAFWPGWWLSAVLIGLGLLALLIPVLMTKTIHYRITSYRIDFERGVFSKNIDTLELWHVDDISFRQSLIERILGVGTIKVISDDRTTPDLLLRGLPDSRSIFDALKERVIAVKRQRGVIKMDVG